MSKNKFDDPDPTPEEAPPVPTDQAVVEAAQHVADAKATLESAKADHAAAVEAHAAAVKADQPAPDPAIHILLDDGHGGVTVVEHPEAKDKSPRLNIGGRNYEHTANGENGCWVYRSM